MAGIYLHIPFCKQSCNYCNFHFSTSLLYKNELVQALQKEIKQEKDYLDGEVIDTIYFGGGTPSLLSVEECHFLLQSINDNYAVAPGAEITLEANPDDINLKKLAGWKTIGINRLSIGVQSFFEEELLWMNRAHNAQQARESLKLAVEYFNNITIDLIYGSPLLSDEMWKKNVDTAIDFGIPHLSCYALTVEEKTPLHKQISAAKKLNVDPDKQARQYLLLMQWLQEKGYEHYEISSFAKPEFRSRHNSAYWSGTKYLGIGPSAHSFNGTQRRWNIANNQKYINSLKNGNALKEVETLSEQEKLNEYLMISLRTKEGINLNKVETQWGEAYKTTLLNKLNKYVVTGHVELHSSIASLTNEGKLLADGIASDLFQ